MRRVVSDAAGERHARVQRADRDQAGASCQPLFHQQLSKSQQGRHRSDGEAALDAVSGDRLGRALFLVRDGVHHGPYVLDRGGHRTGEPDIGGVRDHHLRTPGNRPGDGLRAFLVPVHADDDVMRQRQFPGTGAADVTAGAHHHGRTFVSHPAILS